MIRQQINLYQPQFQPKKEVFPAIYMVLILTLLLIALGWLTFWQEGRLGKQRAIVARLESQEIAEQQKMEQLERQYPPPKADSQLVKDVHQLEAYLDRAGRVAKVLAETQGGNQDGFSAILEGYSQSKVTGVWLTGFGAFGGGEYLIMEGEALNSDLIPELIREMSKHEIFQGKPFRLFEIAAPKPEETDPKDKDKDKDKEKTNQAPPPVDHTVTFQLKTRDLKLFEPLDDDLTVTMVEHQDKPEIIGGTPGTGMIVPPGTPGAQSILPDIYPAKK
jgi:hypothetical protein